LAISAIAQLLSNTLKPAEFLEMLRHAKGYIGFGKHAEQLGGEADINAEEHE